VFSVGLKMNLKIPSGYKSRRSETNIYGNFHTVFKHISPLIPSSFIAAPEGALWYHTFTEYARCELECFWTDSLT